MESIPYHETLGGSWWCLVCHAPASIEDPGDSNPVCGNCGKRRCEFRSVCAESPRLKPPVAIVNPVPEHARPMLNKKRLPAAERPSLREMTFKGYWHCLGCDEPTKKGADDGCVLCGSSQVEFRPPTLTEEAT